MDKIRVLFLCTHNAVRSQISEGLLRHFYSEKYEVFSAGTNPTQVDPLAVRVMAEIGIDISAQSSKGIEEFTDKEIDVAISVCQSSAKTLCALCASPMHGGRSELINKKLPKAKHYFVHGFVDPADVEGSEKEKLAAFRRTRDEIRNWIIEYFEDLKLENLENPNYFS